MNSNRSGIGNADLLKQLDIEPLVDLPGVGQNYMGMPLLLQTSQRVDSAIDHNALFPPYIASDDADTLDVIFRGDEEMVQREPYIFILIRVLSFLLQLSSKNGLIQERGYQRISKTVLCLEPCSQKEFSGLNAGIKVRPGPEDLKELGQEFESAWNEFYAPAPDKPLIITCPIGG